MSRTHSEGLGPGDWKIIAVAILCPEFSPSGNGIRAFGFAEGLSEKKGPKFTAQNEAAEIYIANEGGRYLAQNPDVRKAIDEGGL